MILALGKITSTTPGTPVRLINALPANLAGYVIVRLYLIAFGTNTGNVYIGNSSLNKTTGAGCFVGTGLAASQTFNLADDNAGLNRGASSAFIMNTNDLYFDVDTSGQGFGGFIVY